MYINCLFPHETVNAPTKRNGVPINCDRGELLLHFFTFVPSIFDQVFATVHIQNKITVYFNFLYIQIVKK